MDQSVATFLTELKPAALIVAALLAVALVSSRFMPEIGPWISLAAVAGTAIYVGNQVTGVTDRPQWLLPVAGAGAILAVLAGVRLLGAIKARSNNDNTIGYLFPTAMAVVGMWMSVALIRYENVGETAQVLLNRR